MPTYKYTDNITNDIICDMQDHIPSWTDRIIFKINENKLKFEEKEGKEKNREESDIIENDKEENNREYEDIKEEDDSDMKKENNNINDITFKLIHYNSMQNIVFSDHKPVFAYFTININ